MYHLLALLLPVCSILSGQLSDLERIAAELKVIEPFSDNLLSVRSKVNKQGSAAIPLLNRFLYDRPELAQSILSMMVQIAHASEDQTTRQQVVESVLNAISNAPLKSQDIDTAIFLLLGFTTEDFKSNAPAIFHKLWRQKFLARHAYGPDNFLLLTGILQDQSFKTYIEPYSDTWAGVRALARLGNEKALNEAIGLVRHDLNDSQWDGRRLRGLAYVGDVRVLEFLRDVILGTTTDSPTAREQQIFLDAIWTLSKMTNDHPLTPETTLDFTIPTFDVLIDGWKDWLRSVDVLSLEVQSYPFIR